MRIKLFLQYKQLLEAFAARCSVSDLVKSQTCDVAQGERRDNTVLFSRANVKIAIRNLIEIAIVLWFAIKTITLDFRREIVAKTEVKSIVPDVTMTKENTGKTFETIKKIHETIT